MESILVSTPQQFSVTLPDDVAEAVRAKVAGGEYASESEVFHDGLLMLLDRDRLPFETDPAFESWLRDVVGPIYDAMKADPSRGVPIEDVRAALAAERVKASAEL